MMEEYDLLSSSSSSETFFLNDLLVALKNHDIKRFQDILKSENYFNLDFFFRNPDFGNLLDISCRKPGSHLFVNVLLAHKANPNIINRVRKKAPIHYAVQNSDVLTLRALLDCKKTDVNVVDSTSSSALHYAVTLPDVGILEMLLQSEKIEVNILNKKGMSPLLCALQDKNPNKSCIMALLNHSNLNVYKDPKFHLIRENLNQLIPDWESYVRKNSKHSEISFSHAFNLLQSHSYDNFMAIIESKKGDVSFLEGNNGSHTFLQYCCEFGIPRVVVLLLQANVNPNNTCNVNLKTPLMLAAYKGYSEIVELLLNTGKCTFNPIEKETVLHCVVKGSSECSDLTDSDAERDHLKCLTILLSASKNILDVNECDFKGNTALHYATKQRDNEMIFSLLKGGASLSCFNKLNEPAFADINYKTLKKYLDSCIYTNDKLPSEESYEIILNYNCLHPTACNSFDTFKSETETNYEAPFITDAYNNFECKPLLYMAQNSELKHLLKHPLFTSFLYLKWNKIYKGFYVNLLFYFIFLLSMTIYILKFYPNVSTGNGFHQSNTYIYWGFLIILLVVLTIRELAQLIISPLKYLICLENWLEIGIIYTSIKILFFAENTLFDEKVKLSVISIMLSWGELVLLIGRHPAISIYIEMLKTVSWNFLKFLAWYFALIIAFSLSFYILFGMDSCSFSDNKEDHCSSKKNSTVGGFFSSPSVSLFKTVIMLTGELDASSAPFDTHPGLSHALFIAFLFFIAIVLFNLLNGLAVSDTQAIQSDSELVGYISMVKLIADVETLVSIPLTHKESIFNLNLASFNLSSYLNKIVSKYINLFGDGCLSDGEIRILPFYGNQIQMGNGKYGSNRKYMDLNSKCYETCIVMEMDSSVMHGVKEILSGKHIEKEIEDAEKKKEGNVKMFLEMMKKCFENISLVKEAVQENKLMLNKLASLVDRAQKMQNVADS